MPSDRKQVNVRLDDEGEELLARLIEILSAEQGQAVGASFVVRRALAELGKRYERPKKARRAKETGS